ncbi:hemerythrin domain-containing protein [Kibdelosporangium aridum]|uniref:hemerythrin domain-containing protein n=1 Tax=Kibdelosporangium aridum TaxID=2030 RepID=UPI000524EA54
MSKQVQGMADVRDMYMAHNMFRREFSLVPGLLRGVPEGDTRRSEVVGGHIDLLCRILHAHHEGEDMVVWPRLHERAGTEAAKIVSTMEGQHATIEKLLTRVEDLLPAWQATARGPRELADVFEELYIALNEHMTMEENHILPLAEKYITELEWRELGGHGMDSFSKSELPLCFGLVMYETDPAVIKHVLEDKPLLVRLLVPRIAPRKFAAHAKRVHGTATPARVS